MTIRQPGPADVVAEITDLCLAAGEEHAAAAFLRQNLTLDLVKQRLDHARQVRHMARCAQRLGATVDAAYVDACIRVGTPLHAVGDQLWSAVLQADQPEIRSHRSETRHPKAQAILGWDKAAAPYRVPAGSQKVTP